MALLFATVEPVDGNLSRRLTLAATLFRSCLSLSFHFIR